MKKQLSFLFLLLTLMGATITSCTNAAKEVKDVSKFDISTLRAGAWTLNHVDVNTFDGQGNLIATQNFPFGENTDGGICTFTYDDNNLWTLNDNGELFTARYSLDDRIVYTEGGGTWGLRKMTDTDLEIVLQSNQTLNPCQYTVSGAVYYLSRESR